MSKTVLVTGAAGFIGAFLVKKILADSGYSVVGIDNLNNYYDVGIKLDRLAMIEECDTGNRFSLEKGDLSDASFVESVFVKYKPDYVVNLAAQAGVRYSIDSPCSYIESNIIGFFNILECCRHHPVEHLVFASSSSIYGANAKVPYSVEDKTDNPVSLYAATKKSNELLAYAYSKLYGIPSTGLRFFTVYGPMGRPDMAYFKFANKMVNGDPIQIYNMGDMQRDFTYIDDIVEALMLIINTVPSSDETGVHFKVYNIGNSRPESLMIFVDTLERVLIEEGVVADTAIREYLPMQPGDVYQTYADVKELEADFGFRPATDLEDGLRSFAKWYKKYYNL